MTGAEELSADEWPYVWYWRRQHPERKGQRCKVVELFTGVYSHGDCLVEFPDGTRLVTSRSAVRRST